MTDDFKDRYVFDVYAVNEHNFVTFSESLPSIHHVHDRFKEFYEGEGIKYRLVLERVK
jgi:hypothetical protein